MVTATTVYVTLFRMTMGVIVVIRGYGDIYPLSDLGNPFQINFEHGNRLCLFFILALLLEVTDGTVTGQAR